MENYESEKLQEISMSNQQKLEPTDDHKNFLKKFGCNDYVF